MISFTAFRQYSVSALCLLWIVPYGSILVSSATSQYDGNQGFGVRAADLDGDSPESLGNGSYYVAPAVRKMSSDPGEMFFYEYWGSFDVQDDQMVLLDDPTQGAHLEKDKARTSRFQPAILQHADSIQHGGNRWLPRALLGRAFNCPNGTDSCKAIGRPNSCCQSGLTCHTIKDTGLGDVGCCPSNSDCSGDIAKCPDGYTSCPQSQGGGCCIPGYACSGVGCVKTSTTVVNVGGTTITASSNSPPPGAPTSSGAGCSAGSQTCAASLGGGCCPTDQECAFSQNCVPKTAAAPVRATSDAPLPSQAAPVTSQVHTGGPCPSNFYPCSAYFPGAGCCQIGRNCASTSCPPRTTVSQIVSNGVTILVEPTDGSGAQQGNCAGGWLTCGASVGGGCCPGGYSCGTVSCTATGAASGGPLIAKTNAGTRKTCSSLVTLAMGTLVLLYI